MPFVLPVELVAIAASVLLACLCMAVVYLLKGIAAALPRIDFAFVHIDFGKIFLGIVNPVISWLVGATNELWADFEWWMRGIAYITVGLFNDVKSLFASTAANITHIVTNVIPNTITHVGGEAARYANQQVATLERDIATAARDFERVASRDAAQALARAKSLVAGAERDITRVGAHALSTAEAYTDREIAKIRPVVNDITQVITALPRELVAGIDYVTPAALAGTVAAVAAITSEFERCAVKTCAGPNNLNDLLNGILGLAGLAEFGVFLNEVISHPAAAEQEYANVFAGLVTPLIGGGGDIWTAIESVLAI